MAVIQSGRTPEESSQLQMQRTTIRGLILVILVLVISSTFRRTNDYDSFLEAVSESRTAEATVSHRSIKGKTTTSYTAGASIQKKKQNLDLPYVPSAIESFIINNTVQLGWSPMPPALVDTCNIWTDPKINPYHNELQTYVKEVETYYRKLHDFQLAPNVNKDLRRQIEDASDQEDVCSTVDLGLKDIFGKSQQLTQTRSGFVEPLLPPMRHPGVCLEEGVTLDPAKFYILMSLQYIVHDWAHICRKLKPTSRTVFIDMGASLRFHGDIPSPVLTLLEQYRKMGIVFDHIYGYEMRQEDPNTVFAKLPPEYRANFHWINVGVNADPTHRHNPWNIILDHYNEDDFIVVKLDIDTPAIERPLAHQLLNDPRLVKLVDQFYYEHHVNQRELSRHWGHTAESVEQSFQFFTTLRKKGVASHFWV